MFGIKNVRTQNRFEQDMRYSHRHSSFHCLQVGIRCGRNSSIHVLCCCRFAHIRESTSDIGRLQLLQDARVRYQYKIKLKRLARRQHFYNINRELETPKELLPPFPLLLVIAVNLISLIKIRMFGHLG